MTTLHDLAEWFKARQTPIRRWYSDDKGRYAFQVIVKPARHDGVDGQPLIAVAKNYLHEGRASVMSKVVSRALSQGSYVLLAVGDNRYLFNAETLKVRGDPSDPATSARARRGERWIEAPVDWAVTFEAWAEYGDQPVTPSQLESEGS